MREEIEELINDKMNNLNQTLDDFYNGESIKESIKTQTNLQNYNKQRNDYKVELLRILNNMVETGIKINYSSNMSIEQLENIINQVKKQK